MARILVLGNDEFRTTIIKRLASLGYESVQVELAVPMPDHVFDDAVVDAAIFDYHLSKETGARGLRHIRMRLGAVPPVIMLSARRDTIDALFSPDCWLHIPLIPHTSISAAARRARTCVVQLAAQAWSMEAARVYPIDADSLR